MDLQFFFLYEWLSSGLLLLSGYVCLFTSASFILYLCELFVYPAEFFYPDCLYIFILYLCELFVYPAEFFYPDCLYICVSSHILC